MMAALYQRILYLFIFIIVSPGVFAITCPTPDENSTAGQVIINEISFHGTSSQNDWFELYITDGSVSLDGWQVTLLGRGGIDQTVDLPNITFPWNSNSSGKFLVMASSTSDSVISAAISSGTLVQNQNLFIDTQVELHNTLQEMVITDNLGNLVYYLGYANQQRHLDYDCVDEYPDYADFIIDAGNDDNACTDVDGVSAGNQSGDWIAGCNGETSVGETNDPVAALSHYLIEHNASGTVDQAETITVKACINSDCSSLLDEEVTLEVYLTSGTGTFSQSSLTFSSGSATVDLTVSSAQTVQLGIRNDTPDDTYQCLADTGATNCNIVFSGGSVHHYELSFTSPACVSNDITLTVNACADDSCGSLISGSQSVDITYNDGSVNTIVSGLSLTNGVGTYDWSLSSAQTVTLGLANASPAATNANQCDPASCDITFDEYSLVIDASAAEDQEAGVLFDQVGSVTVTAACSGATSTDPLEVYIECVEPDTCSTNSENDFDIDGVDFETEASGYAQVVADFDEANGYDLSNKLAFNDAGWITVTFRVGTATASADFYVQPLGLLLMHNKADSTYQLVGENFDLSVYGYGNNSIITRNYVPRTLQANVDIITPISAIENDVELILSNTNNTDFVGIQTSSGFVGVDSTISNFIDGQSSGLQGNYNSAGTITVQVQDTNYLFRGITIQSNSLDTSDAAQGDGLGSIGTFIPAWFEVTQSASLANSCDTDPDNTPYQNIGESIQLNTNPEFVVTAKDPAGTEVLNFDDDGTYWTLSVAEGNFSLADSSGYSGSVSDTLSSSTLSTTDVSNYDGDRRYELTSFTVDYAKTASTVSPFNATLDFVMSSIYLPDGSNVRTFDTSTLDTASSHQVCYQATYDSNHDCETANSFTDNLDGARMLYTRLALENSFGSETDSITIPIRSQYWDGSQWTLNTDDDCNTYNSGNTSLDPNTYTSVESTLGNLTLTNGLAGTSSYDGFTLTAPDGNYDANNAEVELEWDLDHVEHMMIDWDGNGVICLIGDFGGSSSCDEAHELDYPRAIATFGRYRGNDRIIHWREVLK